MYMKTLKILWKFIEFVESFTLQPDWAALEQLQQAGQGTHHLENKELV